MTIKEKARVAWEKDLEVVVELINGELVRGCIDDRPASYGIHIERKIDGGCQVYYENIADIRFVDAPCEDKEDVISRMTNDLANLEKENAALKQELATTEERENDDGQMINGQFKRIRGLCDEIAELKRSMSEPVTATQKQKDVQEMKQHGIIYRQLRKALQGGYEVQIDYVREGSRAGSVIGLNWDTCMIKDYGTLTIAEIKSVTPVEEPYDIAKERWMVYKGVGGIEIRQKCDGHEPALAIVRYGTINSQAKLVATDAQIELATAAPELADVLRAFINDVSCFMLQEGSAGFSKRVARRIRLLRKLGVINVAPWYKGDE